MTYEDACERRQQLEAEARATRKRVRALLEQGRPVTVALKRTMQHRLRAAREARAVVAKMQEEAR